MELGQALLAASIAPDTGLDVLSRELDLDWIKRALEATGTATIRRRKLPAEHVVWTVVGMALFRDRPIQDVVRHLNLVLPDAEKPGSRGRVSGGAIVQARDRLGSKPLATLFENNEADFGRPGSSRGRAAYPQVRVVALMVLRSHLLAAARVGKSTDSELKLAETIWPTLPENSVTIVDRGFISYRVFHDIQSGGKERHWLTRSKTNIKPLVKEPLGRGDQLVEIPINRNLAKAHPHLPKALPALGEQPSVVARE